MLLQHSFCELALRLYILAPEQHRTCFPCRKNLRMNGVEERRACFAVFAHPLMSGWTASFFTTYRSSQRLLFLLGMLQPHHDHVNLLDKQRETCLQSISKPGSRKISKPVRHEAHGCMGYIAVQWHLSPRSVESSVHVQ